MHELLKAALEGLKEGAGQGMVKIVRKMWVFAHVLGAGLLAKWLWPECPIYGFIVAALAGVVIAVLELELFSRLRGRGPFFFDPRQQATWIGIVGITMAFALSIFLLVNEIDDRRGAEQSQKQRELDRKAFGTQMNSAQVKAGMETMERLKAIQEKRDVGKLSSTLGS